MSDYTPTTDEVRDEFIYGHQGVDMAGYELVSFDEAKARWDRWLASVKADVWDEAIGEAAEQGTIQIPPNPYREQEAP